MREPSSRRALPAAVFRSVEDQPDPRARARSLVRESADNAGMRRVTTRSGGLAVVTAGAVVMGGAGWLRGPAWAAGGVLAGPFIALAAYAGLLTLFGSDPEELMEQCRWQDALAEADGHLRSRRWLAATSPGVFSDLLAVTLKQRAKALRGLRRYAEALPAAGEAVAIFRSLAAAQPTRGCARASSWPGDPGTGTRRDHSPGPGRYPANATGRSPIFSSRR
jgi:hypothetical protein